MFPTPCILNRQQPWEWTSHGSSGYGVVRLLYPRHQPQCADCPWQKSRPRESRGCHQEAVAIPEWRLKAFLLQSAICSALLKSLLAAPKRCIVLDMGSLKAEYALRVPLATWFRFRAAAERLQSNVLLLTQHACSRNSAGLVLRLEPGSVLAPDSTIFTGLEHRAELGRQRFPQSPGNVFPLRSTAGRDRKQPQSVPIAQWQGRTLWAGRS
jgi:hypothetical protein